MQSTIVMVILAALAGCAATQDSSTASANLSGGSVASSARAHENFTVTVPGTEYALSMIAVPAGTDADGRAIGPFWMSKTEITWDLFDVFVYERDKEAMGGVDEPKIDAISRPSKPYVPPDRGFGHAGYAAISVRYASARAFCEWLSARTGRHFRLPTEDEWIYACRAGDALILLDRIGECAWYQANADFTTHPVGKKKPNAFGLYDMLGNVAEWCVRNDDPDTGVLRGGHSNSPLDEVSCTARLVYDESWQMMDPQMPKSPWWLSDGPFAGFRVICVSAEKRE